MALSKMAQAKHLLEEEDDDVDENLLYLNFYQGNLPFLKQVPLHRIPDRLKFEAAALYFGTSQYENEWKGVLEDLGVDYITMYGIDFKSSKTGNLPIYLALNGVLQSNRSFGDFIDVLCKREKFHILCHLKPFVEELLSKKHYLDDKGPYFGPPPSAPEFSSLEVTSSLADLYDSESNSVTCKEKKKRNLKGHKIASEHFQNSEVISSFANNNVFSAVSNFQNVNEAISVFIMHSMLDKKYAKKLATCLREKNFQVVTSANIFHFLRQNPTLMMKAVDEKVDFVVPVISPSFMKQIQFTGYYTTEIRDIESEANTFMYDRLLNEYSSHGNFFNHRVKPVCYSLESRKIVNNDQILSRPIYLPYNELKNDQMLEKEFLPLLRHNKKYLQPSK
ncbi:uncharacterized protein LOC129989307 isoform X1 [Argiope bruennichi]|uniref:uncharacterized protein LOC129989307 isoform X1 n=1 Tax=Argiope bruennichi TaxID=94029 RepID=UPI0024950BCB|nr:uncharacterized protein LOC129989307 isoform X1 [Argiope bruennichi]XP_055953728.1 uncharacterized protein LOC129989307 isoform X1 [Argiope bruennichi]